ncbi:hypothetical protein SAMN05414137_10289 [Streptacidiphilus jiangxiensis]|uniref:Uncharacterized protein n=2 Tax=Streptacidiphilus jiangxiensis TaxID=235985 RepID=A0A1H7H5K3_STRJI|nr:hypothetical protein SAMN05414137_10289 [Streptacidiphilus jiangxiensis]
MTYWSEVRIEEDRFEAARVLVPATGEELWVTAQECADQHLLAELKGRFVMHEEPMPYRVEVRVWSDQLEGPPAATAAWDTEHGFLRPSGTA